MVIYKTFIPYNYEKTFTEELSRFDWKMAIRGKTITVAFLWTYIAEQQGHNSQEKIHD